MQTMSRQAWLVSPAYCVPVQMIVLTWMVLSSNGNAPDFFEATSKTGEVGYDGKCRVFTDGAVATQPC